MYNPNVPSSNMGIAPISGQPSQPLGPAPMVGSAPMGPMGPPPAAPYARSGGMKNMNLLPIGINCTPSVQPEITWSSWKLAGWLRE